MGEAGDDDQRGAANRGSTARSRARPWRASRKCRPARSPPHSRRRSRPPRRRSGPGSAARASRGPARRCAPSGTRAGRRAARRSPPCRRRSRAWSRMPARNRGSAKTKRIGARNPSRAVRLEERRGEEALVENERQRRHHGKRGDAEDEEAVRDYGHSPLWHPALSRVILRRQRCEPRRMIWPSPFEGHLRLATVRVTILTVPFSPPATSTGRRAAWSDRDSSSNVWSIGTGRALSPISCVTASPSPRPRRRTRSE